MSLRSVILLFITCLLLACDQPLFSPVPSTPVYLELNLDYADSNLIPALAAKSFTKPRLAADRLGFGGVLVVNGYSSNGALCLFAYDLACSYEIKKNVIVVPDDEGKARCPECGSVYITMWGMGIPDTQSVSKYPLRSYMVRSLGGNRFVVVN